jgi:hypothetical protein
VCPECFGHIGESELCRFGEPFPALLELTLLEPEVGCQSVTPGLSVDLLDRRRRGADEEGDLSLRG